MSDTPPEPPEHLQSTVIAVLEESDPTQLDDIAKFATELATFKRRHSTVERTVRTGESDETEAVDGNKTQTVDRSEAQTVDAKDPGAGDTNGRKAADSNERDDPTEGKEPADERPEADAERPEDVPSSASVTVKTINDNRYRYWQWRDGDKIRSKYIEPVSSDE